MYKKSLPCVHRSYPAPKRQHLMPHQHSRTAQGMFCPSAVIETQSIVGSLISNWQIITVYATQKYKNIVWFTEGWTT